ncbi:hypothetical protein C8A05DRAFT_35825, partial [Staphylotrichum tortipilum]
MEHPPLSNGEVLKPVPTIITFSDPEEFRARHESATKAEFKVQKKRVDDFNKMQPILQAWVITAPPAHQPGMGYIIQINFRFEHMENKIDPPGIGQSCEIRFLGDKGTPSSCCFCQSGAEIINMNETWNDTIEVVAYPTEEDVKVLGDCLAPLLISGIPTKLPRKSEAESIKVHLQLQASKTTMLAELGALNRLAKGKASVAGMNAFNYLMSFSNPRATVDLTAPFPHLADLGKVPDARLRETLRDIVAGFDEDQGRAFSGITSLPDRICFVPGGPGSGKTWWALTMALLAQSGVEPCRVLSMVDINKPADDAVDRFYAMCRKLGVEKSIIRVGAWPLEDEEEEVDDNDETDFIATTPVSETRLRGACHPHIVIFDECVHSRECSTLISLAHFDPEAWFLSLKMSTMERADRNGAVSLQLLVNHRAYGSLERLASGMFYGGIMRSNRTDDELHPPSVEHLRHWLSTTTFDRTSIRVLRSLGTPRLIISHDSARPSQAGKSCWNLTHQTLVMGQVNALLRDPDFQQISSDELGTIMILSPYKAAAKHYQGCLNKLPTREMKRRVPVRTVDTAQGQEADVVFLDM